MHEFKAQTNDRLGPNGASGEINLDCGKKTKWVFFEPNELRRRLIKKEVV